MNRKYLPPVLMLSAGAVTALYTFFAQVSMARKIVLLAVVLVLFYIIGNVLKYLLDRFDKQNAEAKEAKEASESNDEGENTQGESR